MSETRLLCADPKWIQRVPVEQLGLKVLHTPTLEALVDIVAVHGLGAIPALTWKEKRSGVNWLEDASMLPSFVPRARIMAFGYDSIYVGRDPVKTSIYNIAKDLLEEVALQRAGFENRPLLFVGHCFGGLVVEKAILLSPIWNQAVLEATRGVVLLGTPHRGTETFSSQGQVLEAVAAGVAASAEGEKLYLEAGILEKLSTSSVDLANDPNDFARLCRSRGIEICSFFETRSSDIGKLIGKAGIKEIVVDQSSARLDAEASFPLDVDHFALNKFARSDDGNFQKVVKQIERMCNNANSSSRTKATPSDTLVQFTEKDLLSCIEKMNFAPAEDELKRIIRLKGRVIEEACPWIVKDVEDFAESSSPVMWIHGDAGKGKTMMSSFIIGHLKKTSAARVYFFFCQHDSDEHRSAVSILKSLICQILLDSSIALEKRLLLSRHLMKSFEIQGSKFLCSRNAEDSLNRILEAMLLEMDPSFIIIDGLDECELQSLSSITESITESMLPMTMNSSVKYLLTSRNQPRILQQRLSDFTEVRLEKIEFDNLIRKGVRVYISTRIDESERTRWSNNKAAPFDSSPLPPGISYRSYKDQLCSQAGDSFIWASLICNQIRDHGSEFLSAFLEDCPKGLGPLYSRILRRIIHFDHEGDSIKDQSDRLKHIRSDMSRRILRAICAAERALNIEELQLAVDYARSSAARIPFQRMIEDCGGLIVFEANEVRFIHLSVKNYLLEEHAQKTFGLSLEQAHSELTQSCMHFIKHLASTQTIPRDSSTNLHELEQPFESYAILHSMQHALKAMSAPIFAPEIRFELVQFFSSPGSFFFYARYKSRHPECGLLSLQDDQKALNERQKLSAYAFFGFFELFNEVLDRTTTVYDDSFIKYLVRTSATRDHCEIVLSILGRLSGDAAGKFIEDQSETSEFDIQCLAAATSALNGSERTWKATQAVAKDHAGILTAAIVGDNTDIVRDALYANEDHFHDEIWISSSWSGVPFLVRDHSLTNMLHYWHFPGGNDISNNIFKETFSYKKADPSPLPHSDVWKARLGSSTALSDLIEGYAKDIRLKAQTLVNLTVEDLATSTRVSLSKIDNLFSMIFPGYEPGQTAETFPWDMVRPWSLLFRPNIPKIIASVSQKDDDSFNFPQIWKDYLQESKCPFKSDKLWDIWIIQFRKTVWDRRIYSLWGYALQIQVDVGKAFEVAVHLHRRGALRAFLSSGHMPQESTDKVFARCAKEGWTDCLEYMSKNMLTSGQNHLLLADCLHAASSHGNVACVDTLLSAGANGDMPTSSGNRSALCQLACEGSQMALLYLLPHSSLAHSISSFNSVMTQASESINTGSAEFKAGVKSCLSILSDNFGDLPPGWTQRKTYDGWQYFIFDDGKTSFSRWQDPRVPFDAGNSLDDAWAPCKAPFYDRELESDVNLMASGSSEADDDEDEDSDAQEESEKNNEGDYDGNGSGSEADIQDNCDESASKRRRYH